jgi:two-component system, LytTR family, response regulator
MEPVIRCLIIDDEPPARELLKHYLSDLPAILVEGECANGFEALKEVKAKKPDLLFLDIQMPRIDGFELLELLDEKPEVIFCTAYDAFALKAFEMNAVDYLLKPYSKERLAEAVERAAQRIRRREVNKKPVYEKLLKGDLPEGFYLERIVAKTGTHITVIPAAAIHFLEAEDDYVKVVSELGNHLKERTLKYYEEHLPPDTFVRIHRSFIVNIRKIKNIALMGKETWRVVLHSGDEIRASAQGYRKLRELL